MHAKLTNLALALIFAASDPAAAAEKGVVLLVPGMAWDGNRIDPKEETKPPVSHVFGKSLIEFLDRSGHRFGGMIRSRGAQLRLPDCLNPAEAFQGNPAKADMFEFEFSPSANADGLAFRALELSACIRELRRMTGRPITIVAHSAGGLVARVVLQQACPGIAYDDEVAHLITIATPHLGAALASLGSFIGPRVASLTPDAPLIARLNSLPLPTRCRFTAIGIRCLGPDARGVNDVYDALTDMKMWAVLPLDFKEGGDEVVAVRSANLRLCRCAEAYEQASQRAIQTIILRLPRRKQADFTQSVHVGCLASPELHWQILDLLEDGGEFWTGKLPPKRLERWVREQASRVAFSLIEAEALRANPARSVESVQVEKLEKTGPLAEPRSISFVGTARYHDLSLDLKLVDLKAFAGQVRVSGSFTVKIDAYGRMLDVRPAAMRSADPSDR